MNVIKNIANRIQAHSLRVKLICAAKSDRLLGEGLPKYLLDKAAKTSPHFGQLIRSVLEPHAFINLRKAQGLVADADHFPTDIIEEAAQMILAQRLSITNKTFKIVLQKLQSEKQSHTGITISDNTRRFVRPMDYFIK